MEGVDVQRKSGSRNLGRKGKRATTAALALERVSKAHVSDRCTYTHPIANSGISNIFVL